MLTTQLPPLLMLTLSLLSLWLLFPHLALWLLAIEIFWIGLFVLFAMTSATMDSLTAAIWSLFILCLATSESALGLSLLIFNLIRSGNIHNMPQKTQQTPTPN